MTDQETDPIEIQRRNFNEWLERKNLSVRSVAMKAGLTEGPVRQYRHGQTHDMRMENKIKIAEAHNEPVDAIFGDVYRANRAANDGIITTNTPPHPTTVPVYGRLDRGNLVNTIHPVAYVEAPAGMTLSGNVFAVRTPNTDMIPRFRLREILLVDPDDAVDQGDDAVIIDQDGQVFILRCFEYKPGGQFVGGVYADATQKTAIMDDQIAKIGRVVAVLMGV